MKRDFPILLCVVALGLGCLSCTHLGADMAPVTGVGEEPELPAELSGEEGEDVRERLRNATRFLESNRLEDARREIQPLVEQGVLPEEVDGLVDEIARREELREGQLDPESSRRTALDEVDSRLGLPENYGQTVVIPPFDDADLPFPEGPMEKIVNSLVSMDFEDAEVGEIIETLAKIEGLNVIADQALRQGGGGGKGGTPPTLTVHVTDVPLREVLSYISRNMGIAFHVSRNVIWVTAAEDETEAAPQLHTRVYKLRRGLIPGPIQGGEGGGDTGGGLEASSSGGDEVSDHELQDALTFILVDAEDPFRLFPKRNLLVARGTVAQLRQVEATLREFNICPKQVLIEARFVKISHTDLTRLGFDWSKLETLNPDGSGTTISGASLSPEVNIGPSGTQSSDFSDAGSQVSVAGVLGSVDFNVVMEAMKRTQSFRTLSAPRVTVLNNHEAEIKKGYTLKYWEEWEVQTTDEPVNVDDPFYYEPVGSPQEENIGLSLKVKVNIGHDSDTVFMSLVPASTQLDGFFNYGTGNDPQEFMEGASNDSSEEGQKSYQLPRISENSVSTTVVARSGQTVVLGGMIETRVVDQERKVPFLGDVPLMGRLFRSNESVSEPEHLLIFVTPKIINERGEFVRVRR